MATQTTLPWSPDPEAETTPNGIPSHFQRHELNRSHSIWTGSLPSELMADQERFSALWDLHPDEHPTIQMHGKPVQIPRWQQAYGADYAFSGTVSKALDLPPLLTPYLHWCQEAFHPAINGLLLNWYDGALGHYIGKHRDSTRGMIDGAPIITISLGEERIFRLRPWRDTPCDDAKGYVDLPVPDGTVCVLPYDTNQRWTHEVTRTKKATDKRISITARAFEVEMHNS